MVRVRYSFGCRHTGRIANIKKQRGKYPDVMKDVVRISDIVLEILDARYIEETRNLAVDSNSVSYDVSLKGKSVGVSNKVYDSLEGKSVGVGGLENVSVAPIPINSFRDLANSSIPVKSVGMPTGTNLEMLDVIPPASIVEPNSYWHMGFVNYAGNSAEVVGYAENSNRDGGIPNRVGQMVGRYLETIGDGNRPHDVWTVEDVDKDGIIATYDTVLNRLTFDPDDNFYFSSNIMFGSDKVYGDVSQLPIFVTSGSVYLPEMEIDDRPSRTGPADISDLVAMAENWLGQDCHPYDNNDCNGADWGYDGKVDLNDLSRLSENWDPDYVSE